MIIQPEERVAIKMFAVVGILWCIIHYFCPQYQSAMNLFIIILCFEYFWYRFGRLVGIVMEANKKHK
jgi:hypothetical protein